MTNLHAPSALTLCGGFSVGCPVAGPAWCQLPPIVIVDISPDLRTPAADPRRWPTTTPEGLHRMPSTSPAVTKLTTSPGAPGTCASAPATPSPRQATPVRRRGGCRARTALAATARPAGTSSTPALARLAWLRRAARLIRHIFTISHVDSVSEQPCLVEDDYYRFRHQPRGY